MSDHIASSATTTRRAPRQARAAETRRRLLEAGTAAFAAKGYDGVNLVEDVLEPAGISVGSFYHQFADKAELLREIVAEAGARRRRVIVQIAAADTEDQDLDTGVRFMIERLFESLNTDTAAWQLQRATRAVGVAGVNDVASAGRESWTADLSRFLTRWFDASESDLRRAADMLMTFARGFVFDYLDTPARRDGDREQLVSTATAFVVGALRALLPKEHPATSRRKQ